MAILSNGTVVMGSDTTNIIGNTYLDYTTNATGIRFTTTTLTLSTGTGTGGSGVNYLRMFQTGNVTLQNGGTFTDAGFRLDVQGTTRFNGNSNITGSAIISGSLEVPQISGLNTSGANLSIISTNNATKGTIDIGNNNAESVYFVNRQFQFTNVVLCAASNANGFLITRVTPTDTLPNYVTNRADQTTGIGGTINTISLITSGSTRLKASYAGNILIGTTTDAGYKLDVVGTSRFNGNMNITGSQTSLYFNYISNPNAVATAAAKLQLVNAAGNSSVVSIASDSDSTDPSLLSIGGSNKGLELTSNSVRALRVFDATRNVIIQNGGTYTDAGYRLDVQGTMRVSGSSTAYGKSMIVQSGTNSVDFGQWDANNTGIWMDAIATARTSANYTLLGGGGQTYLNAASGGAINLRIANADLIRIVSTNVTLGSTNQNLIFTPTAGNPTLVQTGATSSIMRVVSGTRSLQLINYAADINYLQSTGARLRILTTDSNGISFQTNGVLAGSISSNQNWTLGGEPDVGYRLDVSGSGRFTNNVNVTGSITATGAITAGGQGYFTQGVWANTLFNLQGAEIFRVTYTTKNLLLGATVDSGYRLDVSGSTRIRGYANTSISSSLLVYGSGSTNPVFTVQGSQGELFSVTDSLSGSLFSVNDISGLPILEAFSDNTVLLGSYQAPALLTTNKIVLTASGNFTLSSLPTASYDGAFYDYTARSGSNARAGTIMAMWSGTAVNFTETTTLDFGSTTGLSLGVFVSGANMVLTGSASTTAWTIKTIIRSI